jgi:hypothetical protein
MGMGAWVDPEERTVPSSGRRRTKGFGPAAVGVVVTLLVGVLAVLGPARPAAAADTPPPGVPAGSVLIPHTSASSVATAMVDTGSGPKLQCQIRVVLVVPSETIGFNPNPTYQNFYVQPDDQNYGWNTFAYTFGGPYTIGSGDWARGGQIYYGPEDGRWYVNTDPNTLYYGRGQNGSTDTVTCSAADLAAKKVALEARAANFKVWAPVQNRFTPTCEITSQFGPGGSQIGFEGAVTTDQPGYQQQWTFTDGTTSSASLVSKTATKPGSFGGTFRAWIPSTAFDRSVTCNAEVKAPELGVSVTLLGSDGQPLPLDEPPGVDDVVDVRVRVSADADGVGALSSLTTVDEGWLTITGGAELAEEPDLPSEAFSLEPGEHRDVVFKVRITQAGDLAFHSAVKGVDAIGRAVLAEDTALESVGGIGVDVEVEYPHPPDSPDQPAEFQKDNDGNGVIDDRDHTVTVKVKATNLLDEKLTDVRLRDADEAVDFVNRYLDGGAATIGPLAGEEYDPDFGDLEAGADTTKTYRFLAAGGVNADANVFLRGDTPDDTTVSGFGQGRVQLQSHLALEVEMTMEQRPYTSGQVVRLFGSLENLEEDRKLVDGTTEKAKPLVVIVTPITEGNAGGGYVDGQPGGGPTPVDSEPILVPPGETVPIDAILATQRSEVASQAKVRYLVKAWEQSEEPNALATRIDDTRIQFSEEDGSSAEHQTDLAADPLQPDELEECETTAWDAVVSCNLWVGLRSLAFGIKDLGFLIKDGIVAGADAYQRIVLWEAEMIRRTVNALKGDPAAKAALKQEIEVQFQTYVELKIVGSDAIDAVGNAFVSGMAELEEVAARGDAQEITAMASRFLGENPDLGLAGLAKLRLMRSVMLATFSEEGRAYTKAVRTIREANEAAALEQRSEILAKVRQAAAEGKNPAEAGIFTGGEDVTDLPQVYRGVAGARDVDVSRALKIAEAEDILIAFRSRSPEAARLIDAGEAWLKPQDVKTKTVNAIDTTYLGYRKSAYGKVELTEPPIDFGLTKPGLEVELEAAADAYMDQLKTKFPELASDPVWAAEVKARLIQRTKEYPKELANFSRYVDEGVKIEFGYDQQGLDTSLEKAVTDVRKAEVTPGTTTDAFGVERRYFELKMAGPNGGPLKAITGDIDIVAILNPDRTLVTDPVKRARIYEQLKELLGMQHGETGTYINAEVQAKLLRDHVPNPDGSTTGVDTLFVAGSDGRLRTGFLQEGMSSGEVAGTPGKPSFQLVSGGPAQLITKPGGTRAAIETYEQTWSKLQQAAKLLAPGKINTWIEELSSDQIDEFFDRGGKPIRANEDGTLEEYRGPTGAPDGRRAGDGRATIPEIQEVLDRAVEAGIDLEIPVGSDGPGAEGGTWVPISVADALAGGDPDTIQQAPITSLYAGAPAGATTFAVTSPEELAMDPGSPFFQAGDTVVIDPGGPTEETVTVTSASPFTVSEPLAHAHPAGTVMVLLPQRDATDSFVRAVYQDFLGRQADAGGLAYWGGLLRAGTLSRSAFLTKLSRSPEYARILVRRAYRTYLGREGEPGGVAYWSRRLQQGLPVHELPISLMGSREFATRAGGTDGGFVDLVYQKVLGRTPSSSEEAANVALLRNGTSRLALARSVHASTESRRRRARTQYDLLLRRVPSRAEVDYWVGWLARRDDRQLAVTMAASAEYLAAAARR